MKRYFISYGDEKFSSYREEIKREAHSSNCFDKIIVYTEQDLGEDILRSVPFEYSKGGGYWSWKPYVIYKTLEAMEEGDILLYCDVGCTIGSTTKWNKVWRIVESHEVTCSLIQATNKKWNRRNIFEHFQLNGAYWKEFNQVSASHIFIKKNERTMRLISEWKKLCLYRSDLILDVPENLLHLEAKSLVENRYDQSILNGLIYQNIDEMAIKLLWSNWDNRWFFTRPIEISRKWRSREPMLVGAFKYMCYAILNKVYYNPKLLILFILNRKSKR